MTIAKFINNALIFLTLVAFSAQLIIDFTTINIATSCIILASGILMLIVVEPVTLFILAVKLEVILNAY